MTITGTNFTGGSGVSFGGTAATSFTILSDTSLTATAPAGTVGTVDVTVTTNNGTSSTGSGDQFTYLGTAAPSITTLSPSSGTSAGGASIGLTGTDFTGATAVSFGGTAATNFSVNSATSITATAPALPAGSYAVTVTTPSGTSASSTFTVTAAAVPTLTNLGTSTGTTAGGTSVSITGSGFTGATAVSFGGVAASSFTVNSDTSITSTAPPQNAGTVDVSVSTYAGTTALSAADRFTYTLAALPAVSGLGTTSGTTAGGTAVTINGSGFTGATAVSFGKVAANSFTVVSDTQITATAPPQAAGLVDVLVSTTSGSSAAAAADQFTYTNAAVPAVTSLGTTTGTTAGGTILTLNGSGFTGASAVNFGSMAAASFSVLSDTQISAVSPGQAAGNVNVSVTTFSGTSTSGSGNQFSYTNAAAPAVTGVSANAGSAAGVAVRVGDQLLRLGQRAEGRVDVPVVGDVVTAVGHRRGKPGGEPDRVDAQIGQIRQLLSNPVEIADSVAIAIGETANINLINRGMTPPLVSVLLGHGCSFPGLGSTETLNYAVRKEINP